MMTLHNAYELYADIGQKWVKKSDITGEKGSGTKDIRTLIMNGWIEEATRLNPKTKRKVLHLRQRRVIIE